jgi:nitrogen fixation protein FixH
MAEDHAENTGTGRPLNGRTVLLVLLGFFGVTLAVNGFMMSRAMNTFRGLEVKNPYEAGLAYDEEIAAAREQDRLHWAVDIALPQSTNGNMLTVTPRDADKKPLSGLKVSIRFTHPADSKLDRTFDLPEIGPGIYSGPAAIPAGHWDANLSIERDNQRLFRSKSRITVAQPQ